MAQRREPGQVRDAIVAVLERNQKAMTVAEICAAVSEQLGDNVPSSSVRSYLNINTPGRFIRTGRGTYRLVRR